MKIAILYVNMSVYFWLRFKTIIKPPHRIFKHNLLYINRKIVKYFTWIITDHYFNNNIFLNFRTRGLYSITTLKKDLKMYSRL